MRKMHYKKINELLETLQEAAGVLINMNDANAKEELISNMTIFVNKVMQYIERVPGTAPIAEKLNCLSEKFASMDKEVLNTIIEIREKLDSIKLEYTDPYALSTETDFSHYLDLLNQASEDGYSIIVTSMDTPCGSRRFTPELGEKIRQLGLDINLSDKWQWRVSYCAVVDEGEKVDEKISDTHSVSITCKLGNSEIFVKSVGMQKVDAQRQCSVLIDGQEVAVQRRGISFVIYDKESGKLIDSVNFDTFSDNLTVFRAGILPALQEFMDCAFGITFISPCYPSFPNKDLSKNEQRILSERIHYSRFYQDPMLPSPIHKHITEPSGILEVLTPPVSYIGIDGARHFEDKKGKYLNTANGHRRTTGQPPKFTRTIYIVGGCTVLGIGVRDEGTLASQLQCLLNDCAPDEGFIVENYGFALDGTNEQTEELSILKSLPLKAGDIVVGIGNKICSHNIKLDIRPYQYGELFFDDQHVTEEAHGLVAEGLVETLKENDFFRSSLLAEQSVNRVSPANYHLSEQQLSELNEYKQNLSQIYSEYHKAKDVVGAIVMNCNPFTLGHRYLIEECAKKCDMLIVFVVQEDKSYFPFADRICLVREGCHDLENVCVIGSGKFILSSLTFSEYFNKSRLQDRVVDSSEDVTLFANEIVPAAHIQVRFVGTEPLDTVTNQYNRTLETILSQQGIRFEEIARLEKDGEVISASRVRKLLESRNWKAISKLVPDTTLSYLKEKYK